MRPRSLVSVCRRQFSQTHFPPTSVTSVGWKESLPEITALDPALNCRQAIHQYSMQNPDQFWGTLAKNRIQWIKPFHTVQNCSMADGQFEWFTGGELNVCVNCVDRHVNTNPHKVALIWEKDEPGQHEFVTYSELLSMVCRVANVLLSLGAKKGDRIVLYLPMCPLSVATMLACARIGAIHSIVFAGFSAMALAARINDASASFVITANEGLRGGKTIALKNTVDTALIDCNTVKNVLVMHRTDSHVKMGVKDIHLEQAMSKESDTCRPCVMQSEDPLFMLYTSGSTGKPKGIVHSSAGYLLGCSLVHSTVFDVKDGDKFGCMADIGWVTGHNHVVYGPLANGGTSLIFESIPTYPDPGRYWEMCSRLQLTHFYGAPTALRLLMKYGDEWPKKYDLGSLRVLGSVGEPINNEAWSWLHDVIGGGRCMLIDTWWQTETGCISIAPTPADFGDAITPAMAMRPFFGIEPVLMDDRGEAIRSVPGSGALCISKPWPSIARTIYGDHQRFMQTYFKPYPGYYFTGDGAHFDDQGHVTITGRMDDVMNVCGHRLGTAEIEDVLDEHDDVSESAVVSIPHDIKGEGIYAYVILNEEVTRDGKEIIDDLKHMVVTNIAKYAVPDVVLIVPGLPKTRSGKIMRRILRKIACAQYDDLGDISTLNDPAVVQQIIDVLRK